MYECRSNDDTGTKVASEEVDIEWNMKTRYSLSDDGKERAEGRDDTDDEDGRDSSAEVAVVFVLRSIDEADHVARVGSCKLVRLPSRIFEKYPAVLGGVTSVSPSETGV